MVLFSFGTPLPHGSTSLNNTPTDFMPTITFVKEKKELQVPVGANLRREMMQAGIAVYSGPHKLLHCPGLSLCGSCRVLITKGMENASPMGFMERTRLKMSIPYIGNENTMRLACQTQVIGDMTVENTPGLNLYGDNFFS
jgi:ferredoxin